MNHIVLRSAFPSLGLEHLDDWEERASTQQPFVLDRVVLMERTAGLRGEDYARDDKIVGMANRLPGSPHWWAPIRKNVLEFAGSDNAHAANGKPVITYITRQNRGRALAPLSHARLVEALRDLEARYGYEVHIVVMEDFSKLEQLRLVGRTTVSFSTTGLRLF